MNTKRLACILIPNFPIEVCRKDDPSVSRKCLAVSAGDGAAALIVAASTEAARYGVSPHMTTAQAHTLCPELIVKVRNADREDEESGKILKKLQEVGPFVEEALPGTYFLEASGLTRLYRSEKGLLNNILRKLRPCGYPVKSGLAGNKFVARTAAETAADTRHTIVAPGRERSFLDPLPIEYLHLSPETTERLHDLGLTRIGQLSSLPPNEISCRFAGEGVLLSQLARGEDPEFFLPEQPTADLSEQTVLDYPVYTAAEVIALVEKLLEKIFRSFHRCGLGCRRIIITFRFENKSEQSLPVAVDKPTASAATFTRQLRRLLEKPLFRCGITDIRVLIPATGSLNSDQLELYQTSLPGRRTSATIPHLSEDLRHRLLAARLRHSHLPENGFSLMPFSDLKSPAARSLSLPLETNQRSSFHHHPYVKHPIPGLRLFQPPSVVKVEAQGGTVNRLRWNHHVRPVIYQSGPWELSGGWWHTDFDRLYYEVETDDRQALLLFYDRLSSRWFAQGVFD